MSTFGFLYPGEWMDSDSYEMNNLKSITAKLHDCVVQLDDIYLGDDTLVIPYASEDDEHPRLLRGNMLIKTLLIPRIKCLLRIRDTTSFRVEDPSGTGVSEIDSLQYDPILGVIAVEGTTGCRIVVVVDSVDVTIEPTGEEMAPRKITRVLGGIVEIARTP